MKRTLLSCDQHINIMIVIDPDRSTSWSQEKKVVDLTYYLSAQSLNKEYCTADKDSLITVRSQIFTLCATIKKNSCRVYRCQWITLDQCTTSWQVSHWEADRDLYYMQQNKRRGNTTEYSWNRTISLSRNHFFSVLLGFVLNRKELGTVNTPNSSTFTQNPRYLQHAYIKQTSESAIYVFLSHEYSSDHKVKKSAVEGQLFFK